VIDKGIVEARARSSATRARRLLSAQDVLRLKLDTSKNDVPERFGTGS